jgi:hypothetical protein
MDEYENEDEFYEQALEDLEHYENYLDDLEG